jgi:hypothetical protein
MMLQFHRVKKYGCNKGSLSPASWPSLSRNESPVFTMWITLKNSEKSVSNRLTFRVQFSLRRPNNRRKCSPKECLCFLNALSSISRTSLVLIFSVLQAVKVQYCKANHSTTLRYIIQLYLICNGKKLRDFSWISNWHYTSFQIKHITRNTHIPFIFVAHSPSNHNLEIYATHG